MILQGGSLLVLFFGPYENIVFDFVVLVVYGLGYVAGPCGSGMMIDAIVACAVVSAITNGIPKRN